MTCSWHSRLSTECLKTYTAFVFLCVISVVCFVRFLVLFFSPSNQFFNFCWRFTGTVHSSPTHLAPPFTSGGSGCNARFETADGSIAASRTPAAAARRTENVCELLPSLATRSSTFCLVSPDFKSTNHASPFGRRSSCKAPPQRT